MKRNDGREGDNCMAWYGKGRVEDMCHTIISLSPETIYHHGGFCKISTVIGRSSMTIVFWCFDNNLGFI